jgi:quercetin dioxygenase-like cupin family protein
MTLIQRTSAALAGVIMTLVVVAPTGAQSHVMQNISGATWGEAPPMLPKGAQIAVLSGNPMGAGPYTVRLKFPAGYVIPAHSHPTDENVTVISGELFMGMGTAVDKKSSVGLKPGGYALMPANANHFAYTAEETTIVLYGIGPVEFKYANPSDDPRAAAVQSRK